MRIAFLALVSIANLLLPAFSHAEPSAETKGERFARWIHAGLLDPKAPIEQRRVVVGEIEALAKDDSDPGVLYLLGSLYRQDSANSGSPLAQDPDRARELLSRAALHGYILAMAKLSTIELQAGNRFEANVWAQLYNHYALDKDDANSFRQANFVAVIMQKALDGFPKGKYDALNSAVGNMIAQYDVQIRRRHDESRGAASVDPLEDPRLANGWFTPPKSKGRRLESGMAEFVIELGTDGHVIQLWVLDAWPNPQMARFLRQKALSFRVRPDDTAHAKSTIHRLPITFDDGRYSMREEPKKD